MVFDLLSRSLMLAATSTPPSESDRQFQAKWRRLDGASACLCLATAEIGIAREPALDACLASLLLSGHLEDAWGSLRRHAAGRGDRGSTQLAGVSMIELCKRTRTIVEALRSKAEPVPVLGAVDMERLVKAKGSMSVDELRSCARDQAAAAWSLADDETARAECDAALWLIARRAATWPDQMHARAAVVKRLHTQITAVGLDLTLPDGELYQQISELLGRLSSIDR